MKTNKPLMLHFVAGYPNLEESILIGKTLIDSNCKYLEVQFPFLDPIADGPIIKEACKESILTGMNYENYFLILKELTAYISHKNSECELICMSYYNPIFRYNFKGNFYKECSKIGVKKFIIPDLPHSKEYIEYEIIPVVSLMVDIDEFKKLKFKSNLIYCLGGFGVTGETQLQVDKIAYFAKNIKLQTGKKLALGFGITTPKEVKSVLGFSDFAVIGSQIIREHEKGGTEILKKFLENL